MENIASLFEANGGRFVTPYTQIIEKLTHIRMFLFDWDGVFNSGIKGPTTDSYYTEADAMGTNLLRFCYWLQHKTVPFTGIISGMDSKSAFHLAKRERFDAVYFAVKNKAEALNHILQHHSIDSKQIAFVFDDVLDLSIASVCGVRIMIRRDASPLFLQYVLDKQYCDYITVQTGGEHAVREACELMIGLQGKYNEVADARIAYNNDYTTYLTQRNGQQTKCFTSVESKIVQTEVL